MKSEESLNILIVDDHPLSIDAYKKLLNQHLKQLNLEFVSALTCLDAVNIINTHQNLDKQINFAFVDYNIPEYPEKSIYNGIDLTLYIKSVFPNCKIIFITMHNEPTIIGNILNASNPEGLISKSDVNFKTFKKITDAIFIENQNYRSKSIIEAENKLFKNNLDWDEYDFQILELISKGEQTKNLTTFIPLSLSAIEKRKATIKKQLLLDGGNDQVLIKEAKKRGLI